MKKKELLKLIDNIEIDEKIIIKILDKYGDLPKTLQKTIICTLKTKIKNKDCKFFTIEEIVDTKKYFGVDMPRIHYLPIIDLFDKDFLCYDLKNGCWILYNIVDKVTYDKYKSLNDISFLDD